MDTLLQDIRFAFRTLMKAPMVTALCVLCIAIGIGLNANIYGAVYAVFQRPFPFADPERLVTVNARQPQRGFDRQVLSYASYRDLAQSTKSFAQVGGMTYRSLTIGDTEEPYRVRGEHITASLFPILGVRPHIGRLFRADEEVPGGPDVILLGYGVWEQRYAADSAILGRVLVVNGNPHTVVGVMPRNFMFPSQEEAWVPLRARSGEMAANNWDISVVARLAPGASVSGANAELAGLSTRIASERERERSWQMTSMTIRDAWVNDEMKLVIVAMMGAVTFVLLIACANVANLLLARAAARTREMAVRAAVGAGRGRIVRQLLTESIILALAACPLGIGIAYWLMDLVLASIPEGDMPYYVVFEMNGAVLAYAVVVALLTGVIFGLAPAWQAARGDLNAALKDGSKGAGTGGSRNRFRTGLAVAEVALSVVLLIGASLFVRSFLNLQTKTGGVDANNVMTMRVFMPGERYDSSSQITARVVDLAERLRGLPGVRSVTASNQIPLSGGGSGGSLLVEGKPVVDVAEAPIVEWTGVTSQWFETLGIPMVRGRLLTEQESRTRSDVAVINETMASRFWPDVDPIGRRFKLLPDSTNAWFTVVGIVRDYRVNELDDSGPIGPGFVVAYPHLATRNTALIIRTEGDPAAITPAARRAIRASDPTLPVFEIRSLEELRRFGFWAPRLFGWMFAMFGIVALILASVGVYGVIAYGVTQRTQEFGVRVALGAQPSDVTRLVIRGGAVIAALGIAIGLLAAFGLTRSLQRLLFDVSASDTATFVGVTIFLASIALLASYVPARRATRVDPLTALRSE